MDRRMRSTTGAIPHRARPTRGPRSTSFSLRIRGPEIDRLDMMCGRFILSATHDRLIRSYLPRRVILHAPENSAAAAGPRTGAQVVALVSLIRAESATENLGGLAMLNALSTALFAIALRLASEALEPPDELHIISSSTAVADDDELMARRRDPPRRQHMATHSDQGRLPAAFAALP
jgi:AraC family transcriptional activator of mtrCDE